MKINKTIAILTVTIIFMFVFFIFIYINQQKELSTLRHLINQQNTKENSENEDSYISNEVKNRILKGYPQLNESYIKYLSNNPKIESGNIKVDWQIDIKGNVINPEIVFSDFNNKEFDDKIIKILSEWKFPEPNTNKYTDHIFKFKESK